MIYRERLWSPYYLPTCCGNSRLRGCMCPCSDIVVLSPIDIISTWLSLKKPGICLSGSNRCNILTTCSGIYPVYFRVSVILAIRFTTIAPIDNLTNDL